MPVKSKTTAVKARRARPVVNSLDDLNSLHKKEVVHRIQSRREILNKAIEFTSNLSGGNELIRSEFLRFLLDGPRDIDAECGYPTWLTPDHYRMMYDREGIAKRVVDCEPEETWSMDPEVYEDEDSENDTAFESAWKNLLKKQNVWHYLQRVDVLSGIGQFGILVIGLDDGEDMRTPVEGVEEFLWDKILSDDKETTIPKTEAQPELNSDMTQIGTAERDTNFGSSADSTDDTDVTDPPDTTDEDVKTFTSKRKLLYMRAFDESVVFVKTREKDATSPRYGLPTMYMIQFRDFPNWGIQAGEIVSRDVHWTRVIHIADNRKMSEVFGIPRMQPVWNRLADLRKIYSASGEAFWKGAFPGITFEVNPELADQGVEIDQKTIKEEFDKFSSGTQRYMATTGVTTKTIPPDVVDPTGSVEVHLKSIAISKGIPYRVLFGSEEAKLAGAQDSRAWNKRLAKRQSKYVTPMIIRAFVDRMIAYGILPDVEDYFVDWPDLNAPTDLDKAQVVLAKTQALQTYVQGGVHQLIPPDLYLTQIMGMTTEEKDAVMDAAASTDDTFDELGVDPNALSDQGTDGTDDSKTDDTKGGESDVPNNLNTSIKQKTKRRNGTSAKSHDSRIRGKKRERSGKNN